MNTLTDMLTALRDHDPAAPLVFKTKDAEISPGYHVTELRYAASRGIDCSGTIATSQEARLQILDGYGGSHMGVGTFCGIVGKGLAALPELQEAPLAVEFGHANAELRLMSVERLRRHGDRVVVELGARHAVCQPLKRNPKSGHRFWD